ncbi:MAG: hypothetical protein ACRC8I_11670 [Plesiomonas shigelloides]
MYLQLIEFRNKLVRTYPDLIVDLFPTSEGVEMFFSLPGGRVSGHQYDHALFDEVGHADLDEHFEQYEKFLVENMATDTVE